MTIWYLHFAGSLIAKCLRCKLSVQESVISQKQIFLLQPVHVQVAQEGFLVQVQVQEVSLEVQVCPKIFQDDQFKVWPRTYYIAEHILYLISRRCRRCCWAGPRCRRWSRWVAWSVKFYITLNGIRKKRSSSGPGSLRGLKMIKAAMCLLFHQGVLAPVTAAWLVEATQVREMKVLGQFLSQK